ncbi:hypothetical protein IWQ61_007597 [Dispira simplex]|nr:hypothetical protein IWQ61_007597 [Dispira simplex]
MVFLDLGTAVLGLGTASATTLTDVTSPLSLWLPLALLTLGSVYVGRRWWVKSRMPAAQFLVPTSSTYPSLLYTQVRKVPYYRFLGDFLANRVEIRDRSGLGLGPLDHYIAFTWSLRTLLTFVFQILPRWIWHSKRSDRLDWCRFHDDRDDLFEFLLGRQRIPCSNYYPDPDLDLVTAQDALLQRVSSQYLELNDEDRVLTMGSGWGTLELLLLSDHSAFITSVFTSVEQANYAQALYERAGVEHRAQVEVCDLRDIPAQNQFTKLVGLEYVDWVGAKNLGDFFRHCRDLLVPGGLLVFQCTVTPSVFSTSFSQFLAEPFHYHLYTLSTIFPGRDTPLFTTFADYVHQIEQAGLDLVQVENISTDAALTYASWFRGWDQARQQIEIKFGAELYRQWELYLAWSSSIFQRGKLQRFTMVVRKNLD